MGERAWWNDLTAYRAAVFYCMQMARIQKRMGDEVGTALWAHGAREWHRVLRSVHRPSREEETKDG